jgi:hypothetical protein
VWVAHGCLVESGREHRIVSGEEAVPGCAESRPGSRSFVDGELLTQGKALEGELVMAAEEEGEDPEQVE